MSLRVLLVSGQITYMPHNYQEFFEELLTTCSEHLVGLALLNNLDFSVLKSTLGLYWLGAHGVANTLVQNMALLPARRRQKLFERHQIPVFCWPSMNSPEALNWTRQNSVDLIVNLRTRDIYQKAILSAPRLGCLNVHHGLLPTYRGTLCDLYALSEERPAGFTIHQMDEKIDAGKILHVEEVDPGSEQDYLAYLKRTARLEARALGNLLLEIDRLDGLPEGRPNVTDKKVFTRNPTRKQIRQFLKKGMRL